MSSARASTPPPDMGGLGDDWDRYEGLRRDDTGEGESEAAEKKPAERPRASKKSAAAPVRRARSAPQAGADDTLATTVRFSEEELGDIDAWLIGLRRDAGRRVDRSEAIRELLRMARIPELPTRKALVKRLRDQG